jgi:hypothetical protein
MFTKNAFLVSILVFAIPGLLLTHEASATRSAWGCPDCPTVQSDPIKLKWSSCFGPDDPGGVVVDDSVIPTDFHAHAGISCSVVGPDGQVQSDDCLSTNPATFEVSGAYIFKSTPKKPGAICAPTNFQTVNGSNVNGIPTGAKVYYKTPRNEGTVVAQSFASFEDADGNEYATGCINTPDAIKFSESNVPMALMSTEVLLKLDDTTQDPSSPFNICGRYVFSDASDCVRDTNHLCEEGLGSTQGEIRGHVVRGVTSDFMFTNTANIQALADEDWFVKVEFFETKHNIYLCNDGSPNCDLTMRGGPLEKGAPIKKVLPAGDMCEGCIVDGTADATGWHVMLRFPFTELREDSQVVDGKHYLNSTPFSWTANPGFTFTDNANCGDNNGTTKFDFSNNANTQSGEVDASQVYAEIDAFDGQVLRMFPKQTPDITNGVHFSVSTQEYCDCQAKANPSLTTIPKGTPLPSIAYAVFNTAKSGMYGAANIVSNNGQDYTPNPANCTGSLVYP